MRVVSIVLGFVLAAGSVAADELFVPMVGQKQGQDGAWWNTEIWVVNPTASIATFAVQFLPAGKPNPEALRSEPSSEELAAGATFYSSEVVPDGQTGVLRIVTTPGTIVYARVFNSAGKGSFGQGIPALNRNAATRPGEIAHLIGLRRSAQYRTNIALFNPSQDNGKIRVRIVGPRGEVVGEESFGLAPGGYLPLNDVLHTFGLQRGDNVRAEVSGTVPLFALASVIDTRSGAPTLVLSPSN